MTIMYYLSRAIIAAVIVVLLVWLLFGDSCRKPAPDHSIDYNAVMKDRERLRQDSVQHAQEAAALTARIAEKDSIIQSYHVLQEQKELELSASKSTALKLRRELEGYREKDTGYVNKRIDSLLNEVGNLVWLLDEYIAVNDKLNEENDSLKLSYQSLDAKRVQLISDLRNSYNTAVNSYQKLYNDYGAQGKLLKRERVKTKIAAVLAVVAGVLVAVK